MRAKDLITSIGCPSETEYKAIVRAGMLRNCAVTIDDVKRCFKIFGKDVPSLKGSTVRQKGKRVVLEIVNVPRYILDKNKKVILDGDNFFTNRLPFFNKSGEKH